MYFGAGWNTNPLPSPAEMMAEHHGIRVDTPYYTEFWFVPYWPFGSFRSLIFFVKPKLFHFQAVVTHVMSNSPFWADFIYFVVIWFASPALSRPTLLSHVHNSNATPSRSHHPSSAALTNQSLNLLS